MPELLTYRGQGITYSKVLKSGILPASLRKPFVALHVSSKNPIIDPDFDSEPVIPMPPFVFAASKTALITGGASGIGLAVAKKCLGHGMKVLIVDNDDGSLASARRSLGEDKVLTAKADVSSLEDWAHLKKRVDSDFQGNIFASINVALAT